jgi:hypothetical protein
MAEANEYKSPILAGKICPRLGEIHDIGNLSAKSVFQSSHSLYRTIPNYSANCITRSSVEVP